jgi:hypothetical protein
MNRRDLFRRVAGTIAAVAVTPKVAAGIDLSTTPDYSAQFFANAASVRPLERVYRAHDIVSGSLSCYGDGECGPMRWSFDAMYPPPKPNEPVRLVLDAYQLNVVGRCVAVECRFDMPVCRITIAIAPRRRDAPRL